MNYALRIKNYALCLFCLLALNMSAQDIISLAGAWDFAIGDSSKTGKDYVMLPGSMLTNDKGDIVTTDTKWTGSLYDSSYYFNPYMERYRHSGDMKFPFFLTPKRHYTGNAWYRKTVYVPKQWKGEPITLFLERPHIETTVYVNGDSIGHQMSLSTPHRYDITAHIKPGETNTILICVYNGIENVCVGQDSHSVTDQTQGNWNGIVGRIELQAGVSIWRRKVVPRMKDNIVEITVNEKTYVLPFYTKRQNTWDEFSPRLHTKTVTYKGWDVPVTFGLRDIKINGRQLLINGQQLFLRGTVENCCFPETGYPPMEEQEWTAIFSKCKQYGLNHIRFHSYCPPEAAFTAADKLGLYLQVEGPSWPNHGVRLRRGQAIDNYLLEESKRIIDEYGHHPSFVMMAAGNEPAGDWVTYCNQWVKEMHAYDNTKIYCGASVGGGWAWDNESEYHVKGGARGLDWDRHAPSSDDDYYDGIQFPRNYKDSLPNQSPIIAHEQGQWCAFPDLKETTQYTGVYQPGNFEIFSDLLRDNGMASQAEKFLMASGRLQTLCYKYEIERNLRTPGYAGFQLLGLNDYSGQGTALVGVLNVHWREKGYCDYEKWRQFCAPVVPLARFPKFIYSNTDTLKIPVEVYNAAYATLTDVHGSYYISDDSAHVYGGGLLTTSDLPMGKNIGIGKIVMPLDSINEAKKLTLTVKLADRLKNQWDFWVYPSAALKDNEERIKDNDEKVKDIICITSDYNEALKALNNGATVLLTAGGKVTLGSDVKQTYLPVFWNTSWFKMRPPHTTGAYIDNTHPLFRHGFPTDDWANINWWELLNKAQVMNLRELPADYQSPVQPIDTWHVSRKLGMIIEANVGKGRLLMTTMDITSNLDQRLVARQMRHAILSYMNSTDFQPQLTLTPTTISHFFTEQAPPVNMFTNDSPDELKPKIQ